MPHRIVQINSCLINEETIDKIVEKFDVEQYWKIIGENGLKTYNFLIQEYFTQSLLDAITSISGHDKEAKIIILPVEGVLPKKETDKKTEQKSQKTKKAKKSLSREELMDDIESSSKLDSTFILLVIFSTLAAAVGLMENNTAVVVGAMVIAPMLGPNIAFAFGTALADFKLMKESTITNLVGFSITLSISVLIGYLFDIDLESEEILLRTTFGLESIILALVAGAAGVLSFTGGVSAVLVGVMVAVALLPPAVTFAMLAGSGEYSLATNAGILLLINIICINLSAKLVFFLKGIKPKSWYDREKAQKRMLAYITIWIIMLVVLGGLVYYNNIEILPTKNI